MVTDQSWDYLIAGAGISGTLMAMHLVKTYPEAKILVLEQEPRVGGRLKVSDQVGTFGLGLNKIDEDLAQLFQEQTEHLDSAIASKIESFSDHKEKPLAVLAANNITLLEDSPISYKGFRALGGAAAGKNWADFETSVLDAKDEIKPISQIWKTGKKSPGVVVMQHYGRSMGIPDFLQASSRVIKDRVGAYQGISGDWDCGIMEIHERLCKHEHYNLMTNAQVMKGEFSEDVWTITSKCGSFLAKNLIVAQPPWAASLWLGKKYWPKSLLKILTKTTPSSLVTLATTVQQKGEDFVLPFKSIFIPAEECQAIVENDRSIVFQITLDFESSMQAPNVLRAVRQLKRARKKLNSALEEHLTLEGEYIALVPTAWAQPFQSNHAPVYLDDSEIYSEDHQLLFVGDAYGNSYDGDENCVKSFQKASALFDGARV